MTNYHLETNCHYRLTITTPTKQIFAAHVMWHENGKLMVTEFLKDMERVDEVVEVLDLVHGWRTRDRIPPTPPGDHKEYVWDWDELRWERTELSSDAPPFVALNPF